MISAAANAGSVVPRWTNDHGVSGSNPSGAPFDIFHFVRDLLFPLLKKSVRYLSRESNLYSSAFLQNITRVFQA